MSRFMRCRVVAVLGVALVLSVVAAAWSGTGTHSSPASFTLKVIPASAVHHGWQPPRVGNKNGTSTNWSGYAVFPKAQNVPAGKGKKPAGTTTPTFTAVTGTWVVPTVSPSTSANTYSSTWVGLDGYNTNTVEQIGIEQDWADGAPAYYAWFEMYPKWAYEIVGFPVNPGDTITASVAAQAKGAFTLTITNVTCKQTFTTTQRAPSAQLQSAEWVEEAPWSGGVLPLANFGTVGFSACSATMNGHAGPINDSQWQYDAITMATSGGATKAVPSGLSGGTDFTVEWCGE